MLRQYRIGVIGHTGRGDYGHAVDRVWLEFDNCQIVGVADPDPRGRSAAQERLKVEQAFADYHRMLDEVRPDIVSVCPRWLDQHHAMIRAAAERGIHIFTEKPFCRTLEEADDLVNVCEAKKVKLAIAHQTRYSPTLDVIRQLIDSGRIGKLLELRGRGKEDHRGGGEDLWVLGSHIMNLIQYFGGEAKWCFAEVLEEGHRVTRHDVVEGNEGIGPLAGDTVQAMYGLENGVTAYFGSHRNAAGGRFGLQLFGSAGVIEVLTGSLPQVHLLEDPAWSPGRSKKPWAPISSQGVNARETYEDRGLLGGNVLACRDLMNAIEQDRQPEANIYEARHTIEMIASVFESHRLNQPVPLPLASRKNPLAML
jgi:predicted dehydrogenase